MERRFGGIMRRFFRDNDGPDGKARQVLRRYLMAEVIDGKKVAGDVLGKVKALTADLGAKGITPGLATH